MLKFFILLCFLVMGLNAKESAGHAKLLLSHNSVEAGTDFLVGIKLVAPEGWHSYWKNPGDSGMSTSVKWLKREGFTASPLMFPAPRIFESYGMKSYGHENEVLLLMRVQVDKFFTEQQLDFSLELDWLVCKKLCLPGSAKLSGQVKIGERTKSKDHQLLVGKEKSLPRQVKAISNFKEGLLSIHFETQQEIANQVVFICEDEESSVSGTVKLVQKTPGSYSLKIKGNPELQKGILIWTSPKGESLSLALDWQE